MRFFVWTWILLEIAVFIWVGKMIGVIWTLLLVLASMVIGLTLLRIQGIHLIREIAQKSRTRRLEPSDIMNTSFMMLGGVLLLIPGFLSDVVGILCLIPFIRRHVIRWIILAVGVPGNLKDKSRIYHD